MWVEVFVEEWSRGKGEGESEIRGSRLGVWSAFESRIRPVRGVVIKYSKRTSYELKETELAGKKLAQAMSNIWVGGGEKGGS